MLTHTRKTAGKRLSGSIYSGKDLIPTIKSKPILLLISDPETRNDLRHLLVENHYCPLLMAEPKELFKALRENQSSVILIDCAALSCYGTGVISKIKVACRHGRIIVFCNKAHLCDSHHRNLIKEIMAIGVYACILAPYKSWEVLSLVSYDSHQQKK